MSLFSIESRIACGTALTFLNTVGCNPVGIEAALIPNRRCATRPPANLLPSLRLGRLGQSASQRKPPRGPEPLFIQAIGTFHSSHWNLGLFKPLEPWFIQATGSL